MREISAITKDLTDAASQIQHKRKELDAANKAQEVASAAHDEAQIKAATFRNELNEALNVLVPSSVDPRVRQSH